MSTCSILLLWSAPVVATLFTLAAVESKMSGKIVDEDGFTTSKSKSFTRTLSVSKEGAGSCQYNNTFS